MQKFVNQSTLKIGMSGLVGYEKSTLRNSIRPLTLSGIKVPLMSIDGVLSMYSKTFLDAPTDCISPVHTSPSC